MNNYKNKKAFSILELIAVVMIIMILTTISFLSFNNYSIKARDSVRLSDINEIVTGLRMQRTKLGKYPKPENYISITASGVNIGYQGYFGAGILKMINMSSGKDPLDQVYYTYNTNNNRSKYQIIGFFEDGGNNALSFIENGGVNGNINLLSSSFGAEGNGSSVITRNGAIYNNFNLINEVQADNLDYSKRYPYTQGNEMGILLSSGTQVPIQYNNTSSGFELNTATGGDQIIYLGKNNTIEGTGTTMGGLVGLYNSISVNSKYPGCDTPDIKLTNGQVWAACNVGASRAYDNSVSIKNCGAGAECNGPIRNTLGSYFQWGRNDDVASTTTTGSLAQTGTLANTVGHNLFIITLTSPYTWMMGYNNNLWGGSGTTGNYGTYRTVDTSSQFSMRGPCAFGYHVPTIKEVLDAIKAINPSLLLNTSLQNDNSVQRTLRLPLAGSRYYGRGGYSGGGDSASYWTSSARLTDGSYIFNLFKKQIRPSNSNPRAQGFSVRCLKN